MIELRSKTLRAKVLPFGATLTGLWLDGVRNSLVLGSPASAAYSKDLTYFGSLVGPVANRVRNATVEIDRETWHLDANEGSTALHSGPNGIHAQEWSVEAQTSNAVRLRCYLQHGQCGLPGNRDIEAQYALSDDCALRLEITATSDAVTLMNVAHHPYWNLDGSKTVEHHKLKIAATEFTPVNAQTLPTGQIRHVEGTEYDFRSARTIPIDVPLDVNFCLSRQHRQVPEKAARLSAPEGPRLTVQTTEPGLQVYNGIGLGPVETDVHDRSDLNACAGIALEPQGWPDAPNIAAFPSVLLHPGACYRQITEYRLS